MSVKLSNSVRIGSFYLHHTQIMIPFSFRLILYFLKVPSCILRFQVFTSIINRNVGNTYFILDVFLFTHVECKIDARVFAFCKSRVGLKFISFPYSRFNSIGIKFSYEINFIGSKETTKVSAFGITFTFVGCCDHYGSLLYRSS